MSDADAVARDLAELAAKVRRDVHAVVVHHGQLLQSEVKRRAAEPRTNPRPRTGGPEGPRLLTGSYNRSIGRRTTGGVAASTTTVGTNDIRGRALEFGNPARGSLAYPHFGPALDEIAPQFEAALAAVTAPNGPGRPPGGGES